MTTIGQSNLLREDLQSAKSLEVGSTVPPAAPSPPSSARKSLPQGDKPQEQYNPQSLELGEIDESQPAPSPPKSDQRPAPAQHKALPQRQAPSNPMITAPSSEQHNPEPEGKPILRQSQWEFTEAEILSLPTILDGISPREERFRRAKGVNFIYQAGALLDLPQMTLWVAGVFFHRFYTRCSMADHKGGVHQYTIASTALFLANKTEEICRKTKDIIVAVARTGIKDPRRLIDEQSKEYWRWRDSILCYEERMLDTITFDLNVSNPYDELREIMLRIGLYTDRTLRQPAWAFCNDACLTALPLLLSARDIAIASLFFSSCHTNRPIDDIDGKPWWVVVGGDEDHCALAVRVMFQFYTENPLQKSVPDISSPKFFLSNTRKTDRVIRDSSLNVVTPMGTHGMGSRAVSLDPTVAASGGVSIVGSSVSMDLGVSPTPSLKRKVCPSEDGDGSQSKRVRVNGE